METHSLTTEGNSAYHFDADPDLDFYSMPIPDSDFYLMPIPDSDFYLMRMRIQIYCRLPKRCLKGTQSVKYLQEKV
jgi:hypothetical protein